ncbi:uncharacterized protein PF11_0207-like [Centruroides sculpturatus]|uniref:uncharacterized protein PF11_0207-like n=1 Tax=Centruroides sculpturatus TaxID=218467 RepID=UPI000C6EEFA3|nr:uncharacterized protein PF11_0207-like [Centruroides sculpturatus]
MDEKRKDLIKEFNKDTSNIIEELQDYIEDNRNGRMSTPDHYNIIMNSIQKIVKLAEIKIIEIGSTTRLDRDSLGNLKEEIKEIVQQNNEKTLQMVEQLREEIREIRKMKETGKSEEEERSDIKRELEQLITENTKKTIDAITTVQGDITELNKSYSKPISAQTQNTSYSEILKLGRKQTDIALPTPTPRYSILVHSKNKKKTSEEIKKIMVKNVNPTDINIGVKQMRMIKDGGVVVELTSSEDMTTLKKELDKIKELETVERKKKLPTIKIVSVPKDIEKEELVHKMYEQNMCLSENLSETFVEKQIKIKYSIPQKDSTLQTWIMEVSPMIREILINEEKLYIGWVRCTVYDHITVIRCFKCLNFGHFAKECQEKEQVCSHCNGAHIYKDCVKEGPATCINCVRNSLTEVNHNSMDKHCPSYVKQLRKLLGIQRQ